MSPAEKITLTAAIAADEQIAVEFGPAGRATVMLDCQKAIFYGTDFVALSFVDRDLRPKLKRIVFATPDGVLRKSALGSDHPELVRITKAALKLWRAGKLNEKVYK